MAGKVTIDDIARMMGKSKGLVSMALANKYGVSEEMRAQIVMTAVRMGYEFKTKKNGADGSRSSGRKKVFVCFERSMLEDTSYWMELICNVERHLQKRGIFTQIYGMEYGKDEEQLVTDFYRSGCVGMITFGPSLTPRETEDLLSLNRPVVLIDSDSVLLSGTGSIHIKAANYNGAYDAMRYLFDRGHRRICFVGDCSREETFAERRDGALRFVERCETPIELTAVDRSLSAGISEYVNLEQLYAQLKTGNATAYLCANDAIAARVYVAAEELSLRIPDDISVMGFDNATSSRWLRPALTTCAVDRDRLATMAVEMLLLHLKSTEGDDDRLFSGIKVEIPVTVTERDSVGALRDAGV